MSCIDYNFIHFNDDIFRHILDDIYNEPTQLFYISPRDLNELVELTYHTLKLKSNIVIINYYNELSIVGFDSYENKFKLYTLPDNFEHIMANLGIVFENTTYLNIQQTQLDTIDYYVSMNTSDDIKWEFDNNGFKIYTIIA